MILIGLIEKFKKQATICGSTNYTDKKSVGVYVKALDKIFVIFYTIKKIGENGIEEFSFLLNINEKNLKFWAAALFTNGET